MGSRASRQAPFLYLSLFFVAASFVEGFFVFVYAFEWTLTEFTEIIILLLLLGVQWMGALRSQNPESIELPMLVFCFLETGSLLLAIHQAHLKCSHVFRSRHMPSSDENLASSNKQSSSNRQMRKLYRNVPSWTRSTVA